MVIPYWLCTSLFYHKIMSLRGDLFRKTKPLFGASVSVAHNVTPQPVNTNKNVLTLIIKCYQKFSRRCDNVHHGFRKCMRNNDHYDYPVQWI